jgi:hypothetical protein
MGSLSTATGGRQSVASSVGASTPTGLATAYRVVRPLAKSRRALAPDLGFQNARRTKLHRFARVDPHFLPSLGVATDARAGKADVKAAEPSYRDPFSPREGTGNLVNYPADNIAAVFAYQADFPIDRLGKLSATNRCCGHRDPLTCRIGK